MKAFIFLLMFVPSFSNPISLSSFFSLFNKKEEKPIAENIPIKDWYMQKLEQEERELYKRLYSMFWLRESKWEGFKKSCIEPYQAFEEQLKAEAYASCAQAVDASLVKMINRLLIREGLDPAEIEIIRDGPFAAFDISTSERTIYLCEENFFDFHHAELEMESSILHEIQHIKFHDNFIAFCLTRLLDQTFFFAIWRWNNWLKDWQHFRERRADLFSGLIDKTYAQARVHLFQSYLARFGDYQSETHPSIKERYLYMQELCDRMGLNP